MSVLHAVGAWAPRKSLTVFAGLFLSSVSALAGITIQEQTATVSTEYHDSNSIYASKKIDSQVLPSGFVGSAILKSEPNFVGPLISEYSLSAGDQAVEMNVHLQGLFAGTLAGRNSGEGVVAQAQTQLVFSLGAGDVASFYADAYVNDAQMLRPTLKLYRQDPATLSWAALSTFSGNGYVYSCSSCSYPGSVGTPLNLTSGVYRLETSSLDGAGYGSPGFVNDLKVVVSIGGASAPPIPEPASVVLMGLGLVAVGAVARRRCA